MTDTHFDRQPHFFQALLLSAQVAPELGIRSEQPSHVLLQSDEVGIDRGRFSHDMEKSHSAADALGDFARQLHSVVDIFFPAGADQNAPDSVTVADRDQNRWRNRFDNLVGLLRSPIQSAVALAARSYYGEVIFVRSRLGQNLADRLAGTDHNVWKNVSLVEHRRFALERPP